MTPADLESLDDDVRNAQNKAQVDDALRMVWAAVFAVLWKDGHTTEACTTAADEAVRDARQEIAGREVL